MERVPILILLPFLLSKAMALMRPGPLRWLVIRWLSREAMENILEDAMVAGKEVPILILHLSMFQVINLGHSGLPFSMRMASILSSRIMENS